MKKKVVLIILTIIAVVMFFFPLFHPIEIKGKLIPYEYTVYLMHVEITRYTGNQQEVKVPAYIMGKPVTILSGEDDTPYFKGVFQDNEQIESVIIPNTVKKINSVIFYNCANLKKVVLGKNIETIRYGIFNHCVSLESVNIPPKVKIIPSGFAKNCKSIKTIEIPQSVIEIQDEAFANCTMLEKVIIPNSVQRICGSSFDNTPWLNNQTDEFVIVNNSILLKYNGNKKEVTVPENITYIGTDTFKDNANITSIIIPENVNYIDLGTIRNCKNLDSIVIQGKNTDLCFEIYSDCNDSVRIIVPSGSTAEKIAKREGMQYEIGN